MFGKLCRISHEHFKTADVDSAEVYLVLGRFWLLLSSSSLLVAFPQLRIMRLIFGAIKTKILTNILYNSRVNKKHEDSKSAPPTITRLRMRYFASLSLFKK